MPLGWLMWIRLAAGYLPRRSSETQPEKSCDHNDHDHHADNVKNIHCFAPIEAAPRIGSTAPVCFRSDQLILDDCVQSRSQTWLCSGGGCRSGSEVCRLRLSK
jgi:hypothetical protein